MSGLNQPTVNRPLKSNASSNLAPWTNFPQVAQLVEHVPEEHGVGGSIPSLGTIIWASGVIQVCHASLKNSRLRFESAGAHHYFDDTLQKVVDACISAIGQERFRRSHSVSSK